MTAVAGEPARHEVELAGAVPPEPHGTDCRRRGVVAFPEAVLPVGSGYEWDHEGDLPLPGAAGERADPPLLAARGTGVRDRDVGRCTHVVRAGRRPRRSRLGGRCRRRPPLRRLSHPSPPGSHPRLPRHPDRISPYLGGSTPRWDQSVEGSARHGRPTACPSNPRLSLSAPRSPAPLTAPTPGEVTLFTSNGATPGQAGTLGSTCARFSGAPVPRSTPPRRSRTSTRPTPSRPDGPPASRPVRSRRHPWSAPVASSHIAIVRPRP